MVKAVASQLCPNHEWEESEQEKLERQTKEMECMADNTFSVVKNNETLFQLH